MNIDGEQIAALASEVARLREALEEAANALEYVEKNATRSSYDRDDIATDAGQSAYVARAALAKVPS